MATVSLAVQATPAASDPGFVDLFVDSADNKAKQIDENGDVLTFATVGVEVVELLSADLLALFTTPIELIPAPGAGKAIVLQSAVMAYTFVTTPYDDQGGTFEIGVAGSANAPFTLGGDGFLDLGVSHVYANAAGSTDEDTADIEDTAVQLSYTTANPTAGDGTLSVTVTYIVIDV